LQTHVDERAARAPDALIEGFTHHNALGGVVVGREEILRRVRAVS
jgi:DNA-binding transcriptional regulator YbjK